LSGQGEADRDEAIHEARKNVKKIRGVLRLMRPELGETYALENPIFRDVGLLLAQFRDAGAIIETFDALRAKYRGELDGQVASIRRGLMARKRAGGEAGSQYRRSAGQGMAALLRQSAERVGPGRFRQTVSRAVAPGLEATFRRGQKAHGAGAQASVAGELSRVAQARERTTGITSGCWKAFGTAPCRRMKGG
jgi:hypothetical protein